MTEALNKSKRLLNYLAFFYPQGSKYIYKQTGELATSDVGMNQIINLFSEIGLTKIIGLHSKYFDGYSFLHKKEIE